MFSLVGKERWRGRLFVFFFIFIFTSTGGMKMNDEEEGGSAIRVG
jgi:hypothetical protein